MEETLHGFSIFEFDGPPAAHSHNKFDDPVRGKKTACLPRVGARVNLQRTREKRACANFFAASALLRYPTRKSWRFGWRAL
jgi:hypothetical protein